MAFDFFGGIDFSGAREPLTNLWAAVGVEREGKLEITALRPLPFRSDAAEYVTRGCRGECGAKSDAPPESRVLWGCDFPFGIPREAAAVAGAGTFAEMNRWLAERDVKDVIAALAEFRKKRRACDEPTGAMAPLDLRIAPQTVVGARWLFELSRDHGVCVVPGAPCESDTTLIEVYPSGTAKDLGIKGGRTPRRAGEVWARPAALREYATFAHPSMEAVACTIEDARDAVLACVTAYLVRDDLGQPARVGARAEVVDVEGWIYRHPEAATA